MYVLYPTDKILKPTILIGLMKAFHFISLSISTDKEIVISRGQSISWGSFI